MAHPMMVIMDFDIFFVFILGAIFGSFLNVCIYRLPKKESIIFPGSYCPYCKKPIKWYDNIPILSYLILTGRCGACRTRIPVRYLVVEVFTAALIMLLYMAFGLHEKFFVYSALACALIVAAFIDINTGEIPDEITLGGIVVGLAVSYACPSVFDTASRMAALKYSALGLLAGGGSIFAMGAFGKFIFKKDAMGGGDVKLMAMIGAFIGWKLVLLSFFIAPFFGAVTGIFAKIRHGSETIPYGPYLSLGAMIAIFYGNDLIKLLFGGL